MHDELKLEALLAPDWDYIEGCVTDAETRAGVFSVARIKPLRNAIDTIRALSFTLPPANTEADVERVKLREEVEFGLSMSSDEMLTIRRDLLERILSALSLTRPAGGEEVAGAVTRLRSLVTHADCYGERADQPLTIAMRNDLDLVLAALTPTEGSGS